MSFSQMFKDCSSLEKINLFELESEAKIEDDFPPTFYNATQMFSGCGKLKEIDLSRFNGNGCYTEKMFENCSSLLSVNLYDLNPYEIGEEMFKNCTSITDIGIPNSVKIIADHAFQGCTKMDMVTCDIPTPLEISENTFDHYDGCVLVVPANSVEDYKTADVWKNFSTIVHRLTRKGDVDGDHDVNITDALIIVDYVIGRNPKTFIFNNADVDSNGAVEITDALRVVDFVLGRP